MLGVVRFCAVAGIRGPRFVKQPNSGQILVAVHFADQADQNAARTERGDPVPDLRVAAKQLRLLLNK